MIMRDGCGSWTGIRVHHDAGEPLCGACQMTALLAEAMPSLPRPLVTTIRTDVVFPPITAEMASQNRRILAEALSEDVDLGQLRGEAA
jgi:hypothetical protein